MSRNSRADVVRSTSKKRWPAGGVTPGTVTTLLRLEAARRTNATPPATPPAANAIGKIARNARTSCVGSRRAKFERRDLDAMRVGSRIARAGRLQHANEQTSRDDQDDAERHLRSRTRAATGRGAACASFSAETRSALVPGVLDERADGGDQRETGGEQRPCVERRGTFTGTATPGECGTDVGQRAMSGRRCRRANSTRLGEQLPYQPRSPGAHRQPI